jgi:DNA gyrase subunit B
MMEQKVLLGLEHVRKRPGMYIGGATPWALCNLVMEVVSNSFDQVLAGRADRIDLTVGANGAITVADNGAGIGVRGHAPSVPSFETLFTTMRDTATADGHHPHVHLAFGTGLGPVSALCAELVVEVRNEDGAYRQTFERGVKTSELLQVDAEPSGTGTTIHMVPDPEIFGGVRIDVDRLEREIQQLAFLQPGVVTTLSIESQGTEVFGPVDDMSDLFGDTYGDRRRPLRPDRPILVSVEQDDFSIELALAWSDSTYGDPKVRSFGNYRFTPEGGRHVDGIEEGFRAVFGQGPMKEVLAGLHAVVHVKLMDPAFPGPTRGRLTSPEAIWRVADAIAEQLPARLAAHPELEADLIAKVPTRTRSGLPVGRNELT